ncbi:transcriptional regulator [Bacillus toyonensis]|uniref:helix-turn-helix transcriptional regulator n=1 Tax=Bacillus toyonensis TaxID=155322 RepID=UPI000BFCC8CB|nr:helix-turn-helix transcriptional regulator [Bacillus toyonensis]PHC41336.1 transcriptional regulator [Bacillus toyonensis]
MRVWLIEKRKKINKTQKDIAHRAQISKSMYAMIENGERNPSVYVAKKIALVLNFEWTVFLMKNVTIRVYENLEGTENLYD